MDQLLKDRLNALTGQNDVLAKARNKYLMKEAERKHFESILCQSANGKSQSEKLVIAQSSKQWLLFHQELAALEGSYEFEKLKFEILDKAFLAEYQTFKTDEKMIKRQL